MPARERPSRTDEQSAESADEGRTVTRRGGVVAAGTLTSRLLGLGREQVLAAAFSRTDTDIFFFAFIIPNLLRQLFAEGAVQTAVIPVLSQTRESQGDAAARHLFRALRGLSLVVLVIVTLAGVVFSPELVRLVASGYDAQGSEFERTVTLTRSVFPYIFFMGTAALGMAALNVHGRFVVTSFAPALLNVAFIACGLLLPGLAVARGYDALAALTAGVLLGGVLQVVAQWPSLRKIGYFERPSLSWGHPGVQQIRRRMLPVLFGVGVYYIDVVVGRRILSQHETGALSYFSFAMRLCDFPQGIFVMALQTAALPAFARLAARNDKAQLAQTFGLSLRLSLFVALPATLLFVSLAQPLVVTIFERGQFEHAASVQTARALVAQGSGIWMVASVRQLVALYYALGDTKTPVVVAAIDLVVFITLAQLLGDRYGHVGVSWAVTLASLTQMSLLALALKRRLGVGFAPGIFTAALSAWGAGLPAALAAVVVANWLEHALQGGWIPGLAAAAVFGLVFAAVALVTRNRELWEIITALRDRNGSVAP